MIAATTFAIVVPAGASSALVWTGLTTPMPVGADSVQNASSDATSCPAPSTCFSAGEYLAGGRSLLDVDTLSNGVWTSEMAPQPPNVLTTSEPYFRSISCPSVTWCTAYGQYTDVSNHTQAFAMTLSGGVWGMTQLPLSGAAPDPSVDTTRNGLSCPVTGFCVVVGDYQLANTHFSSFIDTLSGGSWSSIQTPVPSDASADPSSNLQAVGCFSATACSAAGTYVSSIEAGLLVSLSGATWSAVNAPMPADAAANPLPAFFGVSCPSAGGCVAVGNYTAANTFSENLLATQSGSAWAATTGPVPPDAVTGGGGKTPSAGLNSVDCSTTQWCVAVGNYVSTSAAQYVPEIDTFSNGTWASQAGPGLAQGDNVGNLGYVSCSWPGSCMATGDVSSDGGIFAFNAPLQGSMGEKVLNRPIVSMAFG